MHTHLHRQTNAHKHTFYFKQLAGIRFKVENYIFWPAYCEMV